LEYVDKHRLSDSIAAALPFMRWDKLNARWDTPGLHFDGPADGPVNLDPKKNMVNETKRISPKVLADDKTALEAMQGMDYTSAKDEFALTALEAGWETVDTAQGEETKQQGIADGARDTATAKEWDFHNLILGGKDQVKAKFGENSDQWQSLGMKKKTKRKKPVRTPKASKP